MKFILFAILFESYLGLGSLEVADPHNTTLNLYGSSYEDYYVGSLDAEDLISSSYYNTNKSLTVFFPDYSVVQMCNSSVLQESYIENGEFNFVLVQYAPYVGDEGDVKEINVDELSQLFADFFEQLSGLISFEDIHIVCFARGCELTANFAQMINENNGLKFTRVSLLDPPHNSVDRVRTLQENTLFSDAIHTNGYKYGTLRSVAAVDFFPNGGGTQKTCLVGGAMKDSCDKRSVSLCSHRNSFVLWSETVANTGSPHFCSRKLSQLGSVKMGLQCPTSAKGRYYLLTRFESPFALGGNC